MPIRVHAHQTASRPSTTAQLLLPLPAGVAPHMPEDGLGYRRLCVGDLVGGAGDRVAVPELAPTSVQASATRASVAVRFSDRASR